MEESGCSNVTVGIVLAALLALYLLIWLLEPLRVRRLPVARTGRGMAPDEIVTCHFFADDHIDAVSYNGKSIRSYMRTGGSGGGCTLRRIRFARVAGAVLAISARDDQDGSSAEFAFTCRSTDRKSPWNFVLSSRNRSRLCRAYGVDTPNAAKRLNEQAELGGGHWPVDDQRYKARRKGGGKCSFCLPFASVSALEDDLVQLKVQTLDGNSVDIGPVHKEETIASVKDMIEAEIGLSQDEQRLVLGQKELADDTLAKDLDFALPTENEHGSASGAVLQPIVLIPAPSIEAKAKLDSWTHNTFDDSHWTPPTPATQRCCVCLIHNFLPLPSSFLARFGWWRPGTEHWYRKHKYTFYRFVADQPAVRGADASADADSRKREEAVQYQAAQVAVVNAPQQVV